MNRLTYVGQCDLLCERLVRAGRDDVVDDPFAADAERVRKRSVAALARQRVETESDFLGDTRSDWSTSTFSHAPFVDLCLRDPPDERLERRRRAPQEVLEVFVAPCIT